MLRQRSLAALRREVEPTETEALARFLPAWHGVGPMSWPGAVDRLYEVVAQLQGVAIPASVLERDVLPARVRDYSPRLLDELCAAGEVMWVGAGPLGRGRRQGVPVPTPARARLLPAARSDDRPHEAEHDRIRDGAGGAGRVLLPGAERRRARSSLEALWDLVWAGEVTNDTFAPVRAQVAGGGRSRPAADVVGDGRRVARIVLGNAGFDLADEVAADVGALGEDAAAETGEDRDQRGAEAERHQRVDHGAVVGLQAQTWVR